MSFSNSKFESIYKQVFEERHIKEPCNLSMMEGKAMSLESLLDLLEKISLQGNIHTPSHTCYVFPIKVCLYCKFHVQFNVEYIIKF